VTGKYSSVMPSHITSLAFFAMSDKVVFPIPKCGAGEWSDSAMAWEIKPA
jgi:hypothetical protein